MTVTLITFGLTVTLTFRCHCTHTRTHTHTHTHTHTSQFLYSPFCNPCTRTLGLENEQFKTVNLYLGTRGAHKNHGTFWHKPIAVTGNRGCIKMLHRWCVSVSLAFDCLSVWNMSYRSAVLHDHLPITVAYSMSLLLFIFNG